MGIELNGVLPVAAQAINKRAEVAAERTEITKAEKVGYSVSPIIQGTIDLIQGDSLQEVGDKLVLTTKAHIDGTKKMVDNLLQGAPEAVQDAKEGPVKGLFSHGTLGILFNIFAD